ncbi:MerR family DNA-binding transcriptional regulator [Streptomyces sp. NBC_00365]|uniref:MerR family DNA-binding transcriptional regulator n=1 Tax=Streptomyces sp. NBC_00365 TaxID=2975726 RepID=UPI00225BAF3F|nr:MerR family DNA-binding transcriptional regulator [Streptomyces sp. NBC_00365]MCX5095152.1 MerR family DNA-binding transcriptional regulator [Streptomyces sp. NBC_00365]
MRIGELSRRTGVPTRILRYYEEQGLLGPERAPNGLHSECLIQETAALLRGEIDRVQSRIDCLARNRYALRTYPDTVQPGPLRPADS